MNYKIRVANEAESKEAQELFFELGYKWFSGRKKAQHLEQSCSSSFGYLVAWSTGCFTNVIQCGCGNEVAKEITLQELQDMVNPMKEYLEKQADGSYKLVMRGIVGKDGDIEVPEGADTLAGDERTRYFWKHRVGVKGNMLTGCGESLSRYPKWDDCEDSADEWLGQINCENSRILWQRETLNDKVASAEVARQSGMFVGTPFSDLSAFNFEAVDEFVESNVEQDNVNQPSHYCSHPSGIECIEITRHHDFAIGNAIKYLWRAGLKDSANEIQDLEKASWYIQDKINQLKKINDQKAK